jgi:hypothetical protein
MNGIQLNEWDSNERMGCNLMNGIQFSLPGPLTDVNAVI